MRCRISIRLVLLLGAVCLSGDSGEAADTLKEAEAPTPAAEAYIYGYPLVLMDVTRQVLTNVASAAKGRAPMNRFGHLEAFPTPEHRDVVSPNADTLYSVAWLDLSREPLVLQVPDTAGRYYLMPLMDAWTNVFASPGKRTTGTREGNFAILGPGWKGTLPEGVTPLRAPTNLVWLIGRTQTNGTADFPAVHALQKQYALTPLSGWAKPLTPPERVAIDPRVDTKTPPVKQVADLDAGTFFRRLAALLKDNPAPAADADMVGKLRRLGIVAGKDFDPGKLDDAGREGLKRAVKAGQERITAEVSKLGERENGWRVSRDLGNYGTDYLRRAAAARVLLGAVLPADAIYPRTGVDGAGEKLTGTRRYVLHFAPGKTPPVQAFWSLTLYDADHFFVANSLRRYAIGDRDPLRFNKDGSLDLYIGHESPGKEKESNWLPAPRGEFNLILRLFQPKEEALRGTWKVPPVQRVP
jgi:hypothetical protein